MGRGSSVRMRVSAHSGKSLEPSMAEPKNAKKRKKTYYQGPEAKRKVYETWNGVIYAVLYIT